MNCSNKHIRQKKGMKFDIVNIGSDKGEYDPETHEITIFLRKIWFECIENNTTFEETLIRDILETVNHEMIHKAIAPYIDEDVDDHKIYKHLYI